MNIILNVLVVTVSVAVASSRGYNPCKDYTHGSHNYLLKDPLDCSRYYSCNGQIGYHMHCAAGTSFDQGFQHGYGSCTGPDPSRVPDCYRQRRSEIQSKIHNSSFYSEYFLIHVGHYGPWSYWSSCSKTCGSGIRTRSRTCIKKDNFHTYFCNGPSEDRELNNATWKSAKAHLANGHIGLDVLQPVVVESIDEQGNALVLDIVVV